MAQPMSTLVPLMKFAAKAWLICVFCSIPQMYSWYSNVFKAFQQTQKILNRISDPHLANSQTNIWPGQDDEIRHFLWKFVQNGASSHTPAKSVATAFEGCTNEEAIAKVVEEISNDNCPKKTSRSPELGNWILGFQLDITRLNCIGGWWCGCTGTLDSHHHDAAKCLHYRRQHQASQDHSTPSPNHIHLCTPSHCHQVSGFKEEQEESTGQQSPGSKGKEHGAEEWLRG